MSDYLAYFNGQWIPFSRVKIDPLDRGFLTGDTVFDSTRTFNGKSFRMRQHLDRLYRSLKYVRIDAGISAADMEIVGEEVIARNENQRREVGEFKVTFLVTRGRGSQAHSAGPPTVLVYADPINFARYASLYERGAHGVIVRTRSYPQDVLDPRAKHYSRMNFNLAELEAADVDKDAWPILTDWHGNVTEGTGYNVFAINDGVIRTPGNGRVLEGVSRAMVLDLAGTLKLPCATEDLRPYDLYAAEEVFFSGTSPCLIPVTRIDSRRVGEGVPGPIYRRLLDEWANAVGSDIVEQALRFGS